jgi:membrane protein
MGAALAFYSAFSLAPLLIIVIGVAGAVFGVDAARGAIVAQLTGLVGPTAAGAIHSLLMGAQSKSSGVFASVIGVLTLLVGATTVLVELQADLDRIWRAPRRAGNSVSKLLRSHTISLGLILGIGFLLLVSLVMTGALVIFGKYWGSVFPGVAPLLYVLNFVFSLAVITALIAMLYKWLPNVPIAWRNVWVGALTTAMLFNAGQLAIGLYLGRSAMGSAYGAAGAMVALLSWLYYSAQIFLFGAEFTRAYANRSAELGMERLSKDGAVASSGATASADGHAGKAL